MPIVAFVSLGVFMCRCTFVLMCTIVRRCTHVYWCTCVHVALESVDAYLPVGAVVSISVPGCASAHGCASEQGLPFYLKKSWNCSWCIWKKIEVHQGNVKAKCEWWFAKKRVWKRFLYSLSRSSVVRGSWFVSHNFWCNHWGICPIVLSFPGVSTSSS